MSTTSMMPFLYQTRTLQRIPRSRFFLSAGSRRALVATRRLRLPRPEWNEDYIPFEGEEESFGLDPSRRVKSKYSKGSQSASEARSTITPSERQAFARIFADIAARGRVPYARSKTGSGLMSSIRDEPGDSAEDIYASYASDQEKPSTQSLIKAIMGDAASTSPFQAAPSIDGRTNTAKETNSSKNLGDAMPLSRRQQALLRFPPSLRRAAQLALGVIDPAERKPYEGYSSTLEARPSPDDIKRQIMGEEAWAAQEQGRGQVVDERMAEEDLLESDDPAVNSEFESQRQEVESQRQAERVRVEAAMTNAKSDHELWAVMEAEVFPMVARLGLGAGPVDTVAAETKAKTKRGRKKQGATPASDTVTSTEVSKESSDQLSIHVFGPLYPSHLLYCLRLLDKGFSGPSALVLNVLPRIKELGLASYVLGASTPFYEELLRITWYRYGDVGAVFSLLEEMSHAGLYFDTGCQEVVASVHDHLSRWERGVMMPEVKDKGDQLRKVGRFLQALMDMPTYRTTLDTRISHWTRKIQASMLERERDLGFRRAI